jgi:peptidyl-prolyl cis-trans isomerase B (cyclophilin B)
MPSKKLTSRKRAELKRDKIKQEKKSRFPTFLILIVIIIIGIAGAYLVFSNIGANENNETNGQITNTAPIALQDYPVLPKNASVFQINPLKNDNDPDKDKINIVNISLPLHGFAEFKGESIYYTPEINYTGIDFINYTISDGKNQVTSKVHVIIADVDPIALIDTTKGTIVVELFKDKVPNTVENFINLAKMGFYNGLVFHRVIDNFVIQGGGCRPDGTQKDSPFPPINLEINPEVHHVDGAIAMARTNEPNSATCQFFIDDGPQTKLEPGGVDPNGYAVFGVTIDGIDVVRAIASVATTTRYGMEDWPIDDIIINSIKIENQ